MKTILNLIAASCVVAALGVGCGVATTFVEWNAPVPNHTTHQPFSGMFFSTEYVVEEYEYDEGYCILYDDPDARMDNVEIFVDLETYEIVQRATAEGYKVVGCLVLNDDYTTDYEKIFTYMPSPEFEMAEASANLNPRKERE